MPGKERKVAELAIASAGGGTGLVKRLTGGYGRRSQREKEMNRGKKREGVGANTKIQQQ